MIDSQFRLQGWRADGALLLEDHADDLAALKSRAAGLWATSGYAPGTWSSTTGCGWSGLRSKTESVVTERLRHEEQSQQAEGGGEEARAAVWRRACAADHAEGGLVLRCEQA